MWQNNQITSWSTTMVIWSFYHKICAGCNESDLGHKPQDVWWGKGACLHAGRSYYSWELVCMPADPTTPRCLSACWWNQVLLQWGWQSRQGTWNKGIYYKMSSVEQCSITWVLNTWSSILYMRLLDHAGCEWNGYTMWVVGYGGWVQWSLGGWYTIATQLITLPECICHRPECQAQVHMKGSPEYRVQGVLGHIVGVLVHLHKVVWCGVWGAGEGKGQ